MSFAVVAVVQKHSVVCGMVSLRCRWKYFKDRLVVEPPFGWFLVQCQCKPSAGSLLYAEARPDIAVWLLITVQSYGASAQDYCVDGNIFWKKWFFVCIFGIGSVFMLCRRIWLWITDLVYWMGNAFVWGNWTYSDGTKKIGRVWCTSNLCVRS